MLQEILLDLNILSIVSGIVRKLYFSQVIYSFAFINVRKGFF